LVSAEWLAQNMQSVVVLDVRDDVRTFRSEGHIARAVVVRWSAVRATGKEDGATLENVLPPPAQFAALMRKSGVNSDSSIVIASRGMSAGDIFMQTRLYWQLRYYGHDDVAILDGGAAAWTSDKHALAKRPVRFRTGNWEVKAERKDLLATTAEVERAIQSHSPVLLDTRGMREYLGLDRDASRVSAPGHIPGAKFFNSSLFLTQSPAPRFRSLADSRQLAAGLGVDVGQPAIAYSNTGDSAAAVWFVLSELLGNKRVAVYDGSMQAWTKSQARPRTMYKLE
jgi:thiosulfate/3-mercaptopyruvate sulfurtransferase